MIGAEPARRAQGLVSNHTMTASNTLPHTIDQRLTELEIKASYADDLLDVLNAQVAHQQEQIELLLREVGHLRQQGDAGATMPNPPSARDELPPHY